MEFKMKLPMNPHIRFDKNADVKINGPLKKDNKIIGRIIKSEIDDEGGLVFTCEIDDPDTIDAIKRGMY